MTQNDHEQTVETSTEIEGQLEAEESVKDQEPIVDARDAADDGGEEGEPAELDELDVLRAQLQETEEQAAEYLDGWQRARAEFANYRRREDQRRKQTDQLIRSQVFRQLLPVLDDMERFE